MMQEPIADRSLVDVARLRVVDFECFVCAVAVRFGFEIVVERKDVVHQAMLKILHVFLLALPTDKLAPRGEQILDRNDILVGMSENNPTRPTPPRTNVACY